jgi:soluble lytic murein transglycosylase-like protein
MATALAAVSLFAGNAPRVASTVKVDPHTGRLVRRATVSPPPAVQAPPKPALEKPALDAAVQDAAYRHVLPVGLLHSVIKVESNYNPSAVSPKGAMGLMQLIPATARRFGVENPFDPLENLEGGARYLRHLLDLYGNYPLALAAYNAGEQAVARYGGVPPYPETQTYLARVKRALADSQRAPTAAPAAPQEQAKAPGEYNRIEEIVGPDGRALYISR